MNESSAAPRELDDERALMRAAEAGRVPADEAFHARFRAVFDVQFPRVFRVLDRISGAPDLAADLAQDAFVRLYRRGSMPDAPEAWLITVALNLWRNAHAKRSRRRRLLEWHGDVAQSDAPAAPDEALASDCTKRRVRNALDRLPLREQSLLLLRAEGYAYRDIARALDLKETSIGTLLARARDAFRRAYGDDDASG